MANLSISSIQSNNTGGYVSGLTAKGTAPSGASVSVRLLIPAQDIYTAPLNTQADSGGAWSVQFSDLFDAGLTVTLKATSGIDTVSKDATLPSDNANNTNPSESNGFWSGLAVT